MCDLSVPQWQQLYCLVGFLCIIVSVFYSVEFFSGSETEAGSEKGNACKHKEGN